MTATTTLRPAPAAPSTPAAAAASRVDLYAPIHKALRHFMTDTLHRVGRLDVFDAHDTGRTLGQLRTLLEICENHVHHENDFMHPALEARAPRSATRTADDHLEHFEAIDALRGEVEAFEEAGPAERLRLALRLYRHLALFVAENFQHMHVEETQNNGVLWQHYDDAALLALQDRLLASIPPAEHATIARWMLPALNPTERAIVCGDMREKVPAVAFDAMLAAIRPHLDESAWDKLARALGVAQQPGLVDVR